MKKYLGYEMKPSTFSKIEGCPNCDKYVDEANKSSKATQFLRYSYNFHVKRSKDTQLSSQQRQHSKDATLKLLKKYWNQLKAHRANIENLRKSFENCKRKHEASLLDAMKEAMTGNNKDGARKIREIIDEITKMINDLNDKLRDVEKQYKEINKLMNGTLKYPPFTYHKSTTTIISIRPPTVTPERPTVIKIPAPTEDRKTTSTTTTSTTTSHSNITYVYSQSSVEDYYGTIAKNKSKFSEADQDRIATCN